MKFDLQGFQEASDVSEGVVDEEKSDERQSARQAVIWSILSKKPGNQEHDSASQRKNQNQSIDKPKSLYYNRKSQRKNQLVRMKKLLQNNCPTIVLQQFFID